MVLNEHYLLFWIGRFLWPFLRITGLFLTAPFFGSSFIPGTVKVLLATVLSLSLAMWLPNLPPYPMDPVSAIFIGFIQIICGATMGIAMQIVVAVFSSAGEMIGQVMGLSFAIMPFKAEASESSVFSNLLFWPGFLGYIAIGGPIWLFSALVGSFAHGIGVLPVSGWVNLALLGNMLFEKAVELALPIIAVTLCVNLTVGLMTVFSPSMNLLSIGFPLLILSGLWVLVAEIPLFSFLTHQIFESCINTLKTMFSYG